MKQAALVIIKPDGIRKGLAGHIFAKFAQTDLRMAAVRLVKVSRDLAEAHYRHIKGRPFYEGVIQYLMGKFHGRSPVMLVIYYGEDAIRKCRRAAGATNPEEADPQSVRGAFGRITTQGIFENVVHVSSNARDAKREIGLWFNPSLCGGDGDFWIGAGRNFIKARRSDHD